LAFSRLTIVRRFTAPYLPPPLAYAREGPKRANIRIISQTAKITAWFLAILPLLPEYGQC